MMKAAPSGEDNKVYDYEENLLEVALTATVSERDAESRFQGSKLLAFNSPAQLKPEHKHRPISTRLTVDFQ